MKTLFFLLISSLMIFSTQSSSITSRPEPLPFPKINATQNVESCSYIVTIRTSCSSPLFTRDGISLLFGDAFGNQVFEPRIDDPRSGRFSQCSTDIFTINGPCTNWDICLLVLRRSGNDGWIPIDVTLSGHVPPVTFFYNVPLPSDVWFGFNHCFGAKAASLAAK